MPGFDRVGEYVNSTDKEDDEGMYFHQKSLAYFIAEFFFFFWRVVEKYC